MRLTSGVKDFEVDHLIVHDSVEGVDLLQGGVILADVPACDDPPHCT